MNVIPGSDLLLTALSVLGKQTVTYYAATGRAANSIGTLVTTYASPIDLMGSFQPVRKSIYAELGLDFERSYYRFYVETDLVDLARDVSGDQLTFNGDTYQCQSSEDWFAVDGWKSVLCVRIVGSNA